MLETLDALSIFPRQLEVAYSAFPKEFGNYSPPNWDGIPSEHFTPIEQICQVRDIEVAGDHVRFRRMLSEVNPSLVSIDGGALTRQRSYADAEAADVLPAFRIARKQTVELIAAMTAQQLARTGDFAEYGRVTVRTLVQFFCSHDQQHLSGLHWLLGKIAAPGKS